MTEQRKNFIRSELFRFMRQANFNRVHYSAPEAACWEASAADALQALGGIASAW